MNYNPLPAIPRITHAPKKSNHPVGRTVSWKSAYWFQRRRFLKGFTIYGHDSHLGHVASIMSSDLHFLVPESFHTKFGSDPQSSF